MTLAIRPFITDDGRVVGNHELQLETWLQLDRTGLQQWIMPAYGPSEWVELTIGMVHGAALEDGRARYAMNGPLLQAKILFHHAHMNSWPGFAVAVGSLLPFGFGGFQGEPGAYGYLAFTENLGENERLLVHLNVGASTRRGGAGYGATLLSGLGAQLRAWRGLHFVGEVAYGDAFTGEAAGVVQGGIRIIFNDWVQMDATVGSGVFGEVVRPVWGTAGLRLASDPLF